MTTDVDDRDATRSRRAVTACDLVSSIVKQMCMYIYCKTCELREIHLRQPRRAARRCRSACVLHGTWRGMADWQRIPHATSATGRRAIVLPVGRLLRHAPNMPINAVRSEADFLGAAQVRGDFGLLLLLLGVEAEEELWRR